MSIERSGNAVNPLAVAGAEAQNGKAKVKSGDDADASSGGGFSAVLTSVESPTDQAGGPDTPLIAEEKAKKEEQAVSDPKDALTSSLPAELAMLLQQASAVVGAKFSPAGEPQTVGSKGVFRLSSAAVAADKLDVPRSAASLLDAEKTGDVKKNSNALLDQLAQGLPTQTHKAGGAVALQADAADKLADARALKFSAFMDASGKEASVTGALVSSGFGDGFLRQTEKTSAKSSALSADTGNAGVWGPQALGAGSRVDAPSVIADSSAATSFEAMVADTVSYWVAQGVQNAQLKLDGFGGDPVEVSISLKGDEAHIGFRTDQPEIRQMLEGATAHLKDILTSEGLVLTGVSVGASGQDASSQQEQRNRQGARQAIMTSTDLVQTGSVQQVKLPPGRALDLFV